METKTLFYRGDQLSILSLPESTFFEYQGEVIKVSPLTMTMLSPVDEASLQNLAVGSVVIVAYAQRGLAYKVKINSLQGETLVLSLIERHELRDYFRVETVVSMGYEVIHEVPRTGGKNSDKEDEAEAILANQEDNEMTQLMKKLFNEVRMLRKQVQKETKYDTTKLTPTVVSLSGSGLRFNTRYDHLKGDELRLNIVLNNPNRPITCTAKVVRSEREFAASGDPAFSVATHFTTISDADREQIVRFAFQTQRANLLRKSEKKRV